MKRSLTKEDELRCLEFLRLMGIRGPDHRFLSQRGYFALFLSGLQQQQHAHSENPRKREFLELIRLLTIAGLERVKELLAENQKTSDHQEAKPVELPKENSSVPLSEKVNRRPFGKDITYVKPTSKDYEHYRELQHADTREEALTLANDYTRQGKLHDAYHIMVDYLLRHPLSEEGFHAATAIILKASTFSREKGIPPENMLYECEEMAAVLYRRIPDMSKLKEVGGNDVSTKLFHFVKLVYQTWTTHCAALLEYKYRLNKDDWARKNWIDPRDFGFLVEVMRVAVSSRLPLDLLRMIYTEIRRCIAIGVNVIAFDNKKAKFEGDVLRIIASPTKDVVPDLCFTIFRDIVLAYIQEGDIQSALIFTNQCLMVRKTDREMLDIKAKLEGGNRLNRS